MSNQFDITNHEWSDNEVSIDIATKNGLLLRIADHFEDGTSTANILPSDAIAIAKHFNLLPEITNSIDIYPSHYGEVGEYSIKRLIPQSETTYTSLDLNNVGEIKRHD